MYILYSIMWYPPERVSITTEFSLFILISPPTDTLNRLQSSQRGAQQILQPMGVSYQKAMCLEVFEMKQFVFPGSPFYCVCATGIMTKSSEVLHLPVKVERLQQLYPALSGRHTVRRNRLHQLRAHRHTSENQQGSDGKPAPKPRMHTHSEHLLQANRDKNQMRRQEGKGYTTMIYHNCWN